MIVLLRKLRDEPAAVGFAVVLILQAALLLPDWKAAVGSAAVTIAAGLKVRDSVKPVRDAQR